MAFKEDYTNYNKFYQIYNILIINYLILMQFCENFADFVHRYADSGSSYQAELKSGIET
ncbi:hypothetical protein K330107F9_01780 [Bacteroides stercoris]